MAYIYPSERPGRRFAERMRSLKETGEMPGRRMKKTDEQPSIQDQIVGGQARI